MNSFEASLEGTRSPKPTVVTDTTLKYNESTQFHPSSARYVTVATMINAVADTVSALNLASSFTGFLLLAWACIRAGHRESDVRAQG